MAAMVPLPFGISGDTFIVVEKVNGVDRDCPDSLPVAFGSGCYSPWFGYKLYRQSTLAWIKKFPRDDLARY